MVFKRSDNHIMHVVVRRGDNMLFYCEQLRIRARTSRHGMLHAVGNLRIFTVPDQRHMEAGVAVAGFPELLVALG